MKNKIKKVNIMMTLLKLFIPLESGFQLLEFIPTQNFQKTLQ